MVDAAPALDPTADTGAERQRRYRERRRQERYSGGGRTRHHNEGDGIGPAIRDGEPFVDDFDKCEARWPRAMAGARFEDRVMPAR